MKGMPMLRSNLKTRKPKTNAGKQWKAAPLKPSGTMAPTKRPITKVTAKRSAKSFPKETIEQRKSRMTKVFAVLHETYPDAHCSLDNVDAFQLLIATILSAQCTDARVNMVTPGLFKKFPAPRDFAN